MIGIIILMILMCVVRLLSPIYLCSEQVFNLWFCLILFIYFLLQLRLIVPKPEPLVRQSVKYAVISTLFNCVGTCDKVWH